MSGVPGLWRRGNTWQYRIRVPARIQSVIGRKEINRSLRTTEYRRAVTQARHTSSAVQRIFDEAEARITVEGNLALPGGGVGLDELSAVTPKDPAVVINMPLSEADLDRLAERVAARIEVKSPGEPTPVDPSATVTVGQLFDEFMNDPGAIRTPKTVLAYQSVQRMLLEFIEPNALVTDVDRPTCRRVLNLLRDLPANASKRFPGQPLSKVPAWSSRRHLKPMSAANINKYIAKLSTILGWAEKEGYIEKNPARGLRVADEVKARDKRLPFSRRQLGRIFTAPIFTGCVDDERNYRAPGDRHPRRSRFWIPMIGLFSGMRLNEICQLEWSDIESIDGGWCFRVSDISTGDGAKTLKSQASARVIPVHPRLIALGLLDHVSTVNGSRDRSLFPEIKPGSTGYRSDAFSKWFSRFLQSRPGSWDRTSFHSFRHSFRDQLRETDCPHEVAMSLGGWTIPGRAGVESIYGSGIGPKKLFESVERISYDGIDFARIMPFRGG